jgi:hypothetical protein
MAGCDGWDRPPKDNIQGDEFVFYATPGGTFVHSILVPAANMNPPDVEDLKGMKRKIASRPFASR